MTRLDTDSNIGVYIRFSSLKQSDEHQREELLDWLDQYNLTFSDENIRIYADDAQSGSSDSREDFNRLLNDIEDGNIDNVLCWEISRISRKGETLQRFFNAAEDTGIDIYIANGAVDVVRSDGTNRLVADIIGAVYEEERRSLIRRTQAGVNKAKKQGKWLGQVPRGFRRDDNGYLQPIAEPRDGEDSYFELVDAIQRIDDGESYRSVAKDVSCSRQTLMNIYKGDRRDWYLTGESDDDRVQNAIPGDIK